jgi:hypothetical protein
LQVGKDTPRDLGCQQVKKYKASQNPFGAKKAVDGVRTRGSLLA